MDVLARNASFSPTIKCSDCRQDIELASLAEHSCSTQSNSTSPHMVAGSFPGSANSTISVPLRDGPLLKPQRPHLPRIDPSAASRPMLPYAGELTPASSGPGSIDSPVSATSGRRSPWHTTRKGSIPGPRRPPSPELTNLDCAFPPFPVSSTRSAGPSRQKTNKSTKSRAGTTGPGNESLKQAAGQQRTRRSASMSSSRQQSKPSTGEDGFSRPSTAAGNRRPSVSSSAGSRKPSVEDAPPLPTVSPNFIESPRLLESGGLAFSSPLTTEPLSYDCPNKFERQATMNDTPNLPNSGAQNAINHEWDFSLPATKPIDQTQQFPVEAAPHESTQEPRYRAKRPPPLTSDSHNENSIRPGLAQTMSPATPQPGSAGMLSRSLTKIFGRKTSQSNSTRREMTRQALSDESAEPVTEPDLPVAIFEQSGAAPVTPDVASSDQQAPLSPPRLPGPRQDSLRALESAGVDTHVTSLVVAPGSGKKDEDQAMKFDFGVTHGTQSPPNVLTSIVELRSEEALKHASIDSASSYGSIGFSERSGSSRSTPPVMEELANKLSDTMYSELVPPPTVDVPSPLKSKLPQITADSPTDPFFIDGRLSPIPANEGVRTFQDICPDPVALVPQEEDLALLSAEATTTKTHTPAPGPNKGTCRGCAKIILATQKSVSSADGRLTGRYHKECFVCRTCKSTFPTAEFYVHSDHPYCAHHYHELENSLCATCNVGIEGLYMETANVAGRGKEKHHPRCLKCTTCRVQLTHDYFELSGKVYCERDAFRIASLPKVHDTAPARPSPLVREYISSGDPGLLKGTNFPERRTTRLMAMNAI